jgi:hypothetical protein
MEVRVKGNNYKKLSFLLIGQKKIHFYKTRFIELYNSSFIENIKSTNQNRQKLFP